MCSSSREAKLSSWAAAYNMSAWLGYGLCRSSCERDPHARLERRREGTDGVQKHQSSLFSFPSRCESTALVLVQADMTLLEADELDCSGSELALITGRAREDMAQQPQLGQLRRLLDKTTQCLMFAAGREMVSAPLSSRARLPSASPQPFRCNKCLS